MVVVDERQERARVERDAEEGAKGEKGSARADSACARSDQEFRDPSSLPGKRAPGDLHGPYADLPIADPIENLLHAWCPL